ncbi:hypothetical protein ABZ135_23845 [Streptomyces sp. NPDC006339]|uniref:hypothetical protein n=1 Tax=Streptomyces sp. NPDC006339 TaxID=3156755 RepID=UPI0033A54DD0
MTTAVIAPRMYSLDKHPDSEVTMTVRCMDGGCTWEPLPTTEPASAHVESELHTAETGHAVFTVSVEYIGLVTVTRADE